MSCRFSICTTIVLSLLLLSGCGEMAGLSATPTPNSVKESINATLQPISIISLTLIDAPHTGSAQGRIAITWADNPDAALDETKRFHVGLLDLSNRHVTRLGSDVSMISEDYPDILWSPDGTQLILHGHSPLGPYGILVLPVQSGSTPYPLRERTYAGAWCEWFLASKGPYILCGSPSHGEATTYMVYDAVSWQVVCEENWVFSKTCPPLPLANSQWLHFVWWQGEVGIKVTASAEQPLSDASIEPPGYLHTYIDTSRSPDNRYTVWAEKGKFRLFDEMTNTLSTYEIPDGFVMKAAWSPQ